MSKPINRSYLLTQLINMDTAQKSGLTVSAEGGDGKYISKIQQTNGKIVATSTDVAQGYNSTSNVAISGAGVKAAIDSLDVTAMGAASTNYIYNLSEVDGKISASVGSVSQTYSSTDTNPISGVGVKNAIDGLDVSAMATSSTNYIYNLSETNGKISASVGSVAQTYSGTGTAPISGIGVKAAIDDLDVSAIATSSTNYIYNLKETDGKISASVGTVAQGYNSTGTDPISGAGVKAALDALPEPMIFKGTLGSGGTITSLPAASKDNEGFTYKVITDGTYEGLAAKVGDTFISNGTIWTLIPSGDEPSGTVTNVAISGTDGIGATAVDSTGTALSGNAITSSGTLKLVNTGVRNVEQDSTFKNKIKVNTNGAISTITLGTISTADASAYVATAGGTMSGDLIISGTASATAALQVRYMPGGGSQTATYNANNITLSNTYGTGPFTLSYPLKTGTIALTSDLAGYVSTSTIWVEA